MKDIQKIKEFFSKPTNESLTAGYPHRKTSGENFEKIIIAEPIDDATKNKMIRNFRAAGWDAKPNNGGGITAIKKTSMNEANGFKSGKEFINIKLKNYPKAVAKINQLIDMIGEDKFTMSMAEWVWDFFNNASFESPVNEAKGEYFKPFIRKDKSNPNFLYVDIAYPAGSDVLSVGGSKTMGGQDREAGAAKALAMGNAVAKKLQAKYNIEDIDVSDSKNGKVEVFAVSDDFIKMASPSLSEAKEEDKVDTITMDIPLFLRMLEYSREDASQDMDLHDVTEKANSLGKEKGILSMEDYKEIVGAAEEIDEARRQVHPVVMQSMTKNASKKLKQSKLSSAEYQEVKKLKDFKASDWKWNADEDLYTKVNEGELTEAYYQAVADLGIKKTKENLDTFEEVQEFLNRMEKRNAISVDITKFNQEGKSQTIKYNWDGEQWVKISKSEIKEAELTEAYVPSNIKEFAKRKGVSSLVNKVAGWAEKVGKGIRGGTAIGYNYSTLILDMTYQGSEIRINTNNDTVTLYDEPVYSFNDFKQVYLDNQEESDNGLEEKISETTDYMKRRKAMDDYAVSKKDKPKKSYNPTPSGKTDYMKRREKELAEAILAKLKK